MTEKSSSKKILLMGKNGAGKTAMNSIIFANFSLKEINNIGFTNDINESKIKFLGLNLNINDCGGQDILMNEYIKSYPQRVFNNTETLLYVLDISSDTRDDDLEYFYLIVEKLLEFSKNAKIFVLIHKMDLIPIKNQDKAFTDFIEEIQNKSDLLKNNILEYFPTSVYNESLYKAWSKIVQNLIPNLEYISNSLKNLCTISDCNEIILVEKVTFLIISFYEVKENNKNILKYERISTIIKDFKLTCKLFN